MFIRDRQWNALHKTLHYYGIILLFAVGAGIGGVCSVHIGLKAIWVSCTLLAVAGLMMQKEHM